MNHSTGIQVKTGHTPFLLQGLIVYFSWTSQGWACEQLEATFWPSDLLTCPPAFFQVTFGMIAAVNFTAHEAGVSGRVLLRMSVLKNLSLWGISSRRPGGCKLGACLSQWLKVSQPWETSLNALESVCCPPCPWDRDQSQPEPPAQSAGPLIGEREGTGRGVLEVVFNQEWRIQEEGGLQRDELPGIIRSALRWHECCSTLSLSPRTTSHTGQD